MKNFLMTLMGAVALLPAMASNNVAPWGWATCSDESGTAYMLNGGNFSDATTATLTALGDGKTDDSQIKQAIAKNDIIIFDGSKGEFTIGETMKISSTKNKTLIGINNARLCTKFFLTDEDNAYLKSQNLEGLSSTDQYTGTLPDGTTLTCDRRAFFTKKAIMELQYQKTGVYSLPNKSGIFHIETSSENIIIRNLSLIGPGAVDIDGADLITNQGKHVWIWRTGQQGVRLGYLHLQPFLLHLAQLFTCLYLRLRMGEQPRDGDPHDLCLQHLGQRLYAPTATGR